MVVVFCGIHRKTGRETSIETSKNQLAAKSKKEHKK